MESRIFSKNSSQQLKKSHNNSQSSSIQYQNTKSKNDSDFETVYNKYTQEYKQIEEDENKAFQIDPNQNGKKSKFFNQESQDYLSFKGMKSKKSQMIEQEIDYNKNQVLSKLMGTKKMIQESQSQQFSHQSSKFGNQDSQEEGNNRYTKALQNFRESQQGSQQLDTLQQQRKRSSQLSNISNRNIQSASNIKIRISQTQKNSNQQSRQSLFRGETVQNNYMEKNQPQKKKFANQKHQSVQEKIFRISKSGVKSQNQGQFFQLTNQQQQKNQQQLNDLDNENEEQKLQRRQTAQIDQYYNIYDLTQIDDRFDSELSQGKQGTSYIQSPAASVQRQQQNQGQQEKSQEDNNDQQSNIDKQKEILLQQYKKKYGLAQEMNRSKNRQLTLSQINQRESKDNFRPLEMFKLESEEDKIIQLQVSKEPYLSEIEISKLYQLRCKDMGINLNQLVLDQFFQNIKLRTKDQNLDLSDLQIGKHSIKFVCQIIQKDRYFSKLNISENDLGDDIIFKYLLKCIGKNKNFFSLQMKNNNLSSNSLQNLLGFVENNQNIVNLDISNNLAHLRNKFDYYTGVKLKNILLNPNCLLNYLNLSSCFIGLKGLYQLTQGLINNTNLMHLNLSTNDLNEKAGEIIGMGFQNSKLLDVIFKNNKIMDEGVENLQEIFKHHSLPFKPIKLNFSRTGITCVGFQKLLTGIQHIGSVEKLKVKGNYLRTNDFLFCRNFLAEYKNIKYLDMKDCSLGPDGVDSIAQGLRSNYNLKDLNLSFNWIGNEGAISLGSMLKENTGLQYLNISRCYVEDEGLNQIIEGLQNRKIYFKLDFSMNFAGDVAGSKAQLMLKKNIYILMFNMKDNMMNHEVASQVRNAVQVNQELFKKMRVPKLTQEFQELQENNFSQQELEIQQQNEELNVRRHFLKKDINDYILINKRTQEELEEANDLLEQKNKEIKQQFIQNDQSIFQKENKMKKEYEELEKNIADYQDDIIQCRKDIVDMKYQIQEKIKKLKEKKWNNQVQLKNENLILTKEEILFKDQKSGNEKKWTQFIDLMGEYEELVKQYQDEQKNEILYQQQQMKNQKENQVNISNLNNKQQQEDESIIYSVQEIVDQDFFEKLQEKQKQLKEEEERKKQYEQQQLMSSKEQKKKSLLGNSRKGSKKKTILNGLNQQQARNSKILINQISTVKKQQTRKSIQQQKQNINNNLNNDTNNSNIDKNSRNQGQRQNKKKKTQINSDNIKLSGKASQIQSKSNLTTQNSQKL